ncbi:MAG TPA: aminopeptidase N [Burkholderiaceae bacterium]|nr:aminopeptidase N [Burkholderiaceae bacterium]
MPDQTGKTISRHNYRPYSHTLDHVALHFTLDPAETRVRATLRFHGPVDAPLVLDGRDLTLESIKLDGQPLGPAQYQLDDEHLTLQPASDTFELEIISLCRPADNASLMGLYVSGASLFTQCEAQGFRRITWFPDRPDVMATYRVTLEADKARFPLLLSNGNLIQARELPEGRHEAIWEDPHPKPCYLFALVAGDFSVRERTVKTRGQRDALLQIYSDRGSEDKTGWALDSLQHAMEWDEHRFGLELDLDRFMVVAARDFNMGAMENKGLNIFNSAYVLADPDTATDASYRSIESVIGHEYFHNWTGDRVTCRDWFQLSLKEGLTVFREQEFSADMMAQGLDDIQALSARAVKRIDDVSMLRLAQFPEDAGPMAHPVRPESYQEIANFYTATVYEKGAEVIRMQHTLLGETGFRAGMDEYFRRHDGNAVTCDDFVDAMESVYVRQNPGKNLDVFRRWYSQAGTPRVTVALRHDKGSQTCEVTLSQHCAPVGVEKLANPPLDKQPLHIPFALGLLGANGQPLPIGHDGRVTDTVLLELTETSRTWTLTGIPEQPIPSLLRNFSAPVIVDYDRPDADLALLARHDTDPFARWEACQELATRQLLALVRAGQSGSTLSVDQAFIDTWRTLLQDESLTPAYRTRALSLPPEKIILEKTAPMDPLAVTQARDHLRQVLGASLAPLWLDAYSRHTDHDDNYRIDTVSAGRRALKNLALVYLMAGGHADGARQARDQYFGARNMTDRMGGLSALVNFGDVEDAGPALEHFYDQWQHDPLVIDKWFALQATAPSTRVETVRALMLHPAFTLRNPNRARSLLFQFCMNNLRAIHAPEGYPFWAEQVIAIDRFNPEVAARLARAFDNWTRFAQPHRDSMEQALRHIQAQPALSRNVSEIITKSLSL